jgi:hypothetical protein
MAKMCCSTTFDRRGCTPRRSWPSWEMAATCFQWCMSRT